METGMAPRDAGVGAGCGGNDVGGRGKVGLNTEWRSKPSS